MLGGVVDVADTAGRVEREHRLGQRVEQARGVAIGGAVGLANIRMGVHAAALRSVLDEGAGEQPASDRGRLPR